MKFLMFCSAQIYNFSVSFCAEFMYAQSRFNLNSLYLHLQFEDLLFLPDHGSDRIRLDVDIDCGSSNFFNGNLFLDVDRVQNRHDSLTYSFQSQQLTTLSYHQTRMQCASLARRRRQQWKIEFAEIPVEGSD